MSIVKIAAGLALLLAAPAPGLAAKSRDQASKPWK